MPAKTTKLGVSKVLEINEKRVTVGNLSVSPSIIQFKNIQAGKSYEISIFLQNLSKEPKNIRIHLPNHPNVYHLKNSQSPEVYAPYGLDKKVILEFHPVENREYNDKIVIRCDTDQVEIPVQGILPAPDIQCNSEIDFGTLVLNQSSVKILTLRYLPSHPCLLHTGMRARELITPVRGSLDAKGGTNSTTQIQLRFEGTSMGQFKTQVKVEYPGASKIVEMKANVASQSLELLLPDGNEPLQTIHYGSIYFGQERSFTAVLVNNGPHPSSFSTIIDSKTEDEELLITFNEMNVEPSEGTQPGHHSNSSGTIDPHSKIELSFKFTPIEIDPQFQQLMKNMGNLNILSPVSSPTKEKGKEKDKDSMNAMIRMSKSLFAPVREYSRTAMIGVIETGQTMEVQLTGRVRFTFYHNAHFNKAIKPSVELSADKFVFEQIVVGEHKDVTFTISNKSEELPIQFTLQRIAHFRSNPSQGKLSPLQAQEIVLTFLPKQMGVFNQAMDIDICNGILAIPLKIKGTAIHPNGGTEIPGTSSEKSKKSEFRQQWKTASEIVIKAEGLDMDSLKYQHRKHNDKQYVEFIRQSHAQRVQKKLKENQVDYNNDIDIGIEPASGLDSPRLQLPKIVDSYFNQYKQFMEKLKLRKKGKDTPGEDTFISKKFKAKPTTQAEIRECKAKLSRADLFQYVTAGNKMFDFGTICVYSQNSKSFNITNGLKTHILVTLLIEHEELKKSNPLSQVIPPGVTAGFDVIFCSSIPQTFYNTITYTINGVHTYIITIAAEVTPLTLELSKEQIQFKFTPDTWKPYVSEVITLANPYNQLAEFQCIDGQNFSVRPKEGQIKPHSHMDLEVMFQPEAKQKYEEVITIKVNGGPEKFIRCFAKLGKAVVFCSAKTEVDFDVVAVGLSKREIVTLQNSGPNDAYFHCEAPSTEFTVSPNQGCIRAGSIQDMELVIKPTKKYLYEIPVKINIPGGKPLRFKVKARADIPTVSVQQETFNFGGVYVGATARQVVTLVNTSMIPAMVVLDLTHYPEFFVSTGDIFPSPADPPAATSSNRVEASSRISKPGEKRQSSANTKEKEKSKEVVLVVPPSPVIQEDSVWKLNIDCGKQLSVFLVFKPSRLVKHSFMLPLHINGLPASTGTMGREILAESLMPPLSLSEMMVDFGSKVVLKEGFKTQPYHINTTLTNDTAKTLQWELGSDSPAISKGIFAIEPRKGTLDKGQRMSVRVSFYPQEKKSYAATVPVYLDNKKDKVYLEFELRGTGIYPMINFDTREIVLPVVPLGVRSQTTFKVVNQGYEKLNLHHKLPIDKEVVPIEITFPDGTSLDSNMPEIRAIVSFVSEKSISFVSKIEFFDNSGGQRFSLLVSGASDNCLLTVFPFILANSFTKQYEIKIKKGKGVFMEPKDSPPPPVAPRVTDVVAWMQSENNAADLVEIIQPKSVKNLVTWLNLNAFKNPIVDFPAEFVASNGRLLLELIETLAGKKIPLGNQGRINLCTLTFKAPPFDKKEVPQVSAQRYESILNFLRASGAILGSLKPEYFLNLEDFLKIRNIPASQRSAAERDFPRLSIYVWTTLIYQMVKLFVLSRITLRSFQHIPGVQVGKNELTLPKSNIYGIPENVILKWLSYHFRKMNPQNPRVTNFDKDLTDGLVFSSVILSHVPTVKRLTAMYTFCSEKDHFQANANNVIGALKDLGLECNLTIKDILEPNPCGKKAVESTNNLDMLLFCSYLYNILPQFTPKAAIDFQSILQEKLVKEIELSNPSNVPISYSVTLEGSSDFSITEHTIHLEPRSTKNFSVQFISRLSKSSDARLTFFARRKGVPSQSGSVMVFLLNSIIDQQKPIKVFQYNCKLYHSQELAIEIKNPLAASGKFKMTLQQETTLPVGKDGKSIFPPEKGKKLELPESFICVYDTISLNAGEKALIPIQIVPMYMGLHVCRLLFVDDKAGEFVYEVNVTVSLPETFETFKWTCEERSSLDKHIALSMSNPQYLQAINTLQKLAVELEPCKDQLKKILSLLPNEFQSNKFRVEYSSHLFSGPTDFTMRHTHSATPKDDHLSPQGISLAAGNKLPINFRPKDPGFYHCRVLLYSLHDVRVFEVDGISTARSSVLALDFTVPARQSVTQMIPVKNNTNKDWQFKVTLTGKFFSGPSEFLVPTGQTINYPLVFKPQLKGTYSGTLTLSNFPSGEFIYTLRGVAESPLPEDTISIDCQAKSKTVVKLPVKNITSGPVDYKVESDVPYISGPSTIKIPAGETSKYELTINPQCSGVFSGGITFTTNDDSKQFIWFALEVQASPPAPEQKLDIRTVVRTAVAVQITIRNPLDEPVEFEVTSDGDGLYGDPAVMLGPKETTMYSLLFYPLVAGEHPGSIMFFNESVGEFWYDFHLIAEHPQPTQMEDIKCEIGKTASQTLQLDNPTNEAITLKVVNNNPAVFKVTPEKIIALPYNSAEVQVIYDPSSIDKEETAIITFSHINVGEWIYSFKGRGLLPSTTDTTNVPGLLTGPNQHSVKFANSIEETLTFTVSIVDDLQQAFKLTGPSSITLPPFGACDIPFTFSPSSIDEFYRCAIEVVAKENLSWKFPIHGIPEIIVPHSELIQCKARTKVEKEVVITIPQSLENGEFDEDMFDFEWSTAVEDPFSVAVERALNINLLHSEVDDGLACLKLGIIFTPLRALKSAVDVKIYKRNGGRWTYQLLLNAAAADKDDTLVVESSTFKPSGIAFRLVNQLPYPAQFKAFFTEGPPAEFLVTPSNGTMEKYASGAKGTLFKVAFIPTVTPNSSSSYESKALLVIQTDEMEWFYQIIGKASMSLNIQQISTNSSPTNHTNSASRSPTRSPQRSPQKHTPRRLPALTPREIRKQVEREDWPGYNYEAVTEEWLQGINEDPSLVRRSKDNTEPQ